jgi:hypothetical protein
LRQYITGCKKSNFEMVNIVTVEDRTELTPTEADDAGQRNFDYGGKFTRICLKISRYFFDFVGLAALALSIVAIVLVSRYVSTQNAHE